jgi:hypothetical protein
LIDVKGILNKEQQKKICILEALINDDFGYRSAGFIGFHLSKNYLIKATQ